jgi:hypothetical protein
MPSARKFHEKRKAILLIYEFSVTISLNDNVKLVGYKNY